MNSERNILYRVLELGSHARRLVVVASLFGEISYIQASRDQRHDSSTRDLKKESIPIFA